MREGKSFRIPSVAGEGDGFNRRRFLQAAAAAQAAMALAASAGEAQTPRKEIKTLFFNFSNHPNVEGGNFSAYIGGRIYPLARVTASHPALLTAKQRNSFIRAVPSEAVTHVLENVAMAADSCSLNYTIANTDATSGDWSMPHVFFNVPTSALAGAIQKAQTTLSSGEPFALSAKREFYGVGPALTAQEVLDENDLVDANEHASAMTMLHPDVLSVEADSAAHVKTTHVDTSSTTKTLGKKLYVLGPATPADKQGPNGPGWATMTPVTDENGQPLKYGSGAGQLSGLTQYNPVINPDLGSFLANSTSTASTSVKNDASLGADISAGIPNAGNLQGKLWSTHDSTTSVDQRVVNLAAVQDQSGLRLTLVKVNDDAGFILNGSATASDSGLVNVKLAATNSFARWLGIYIKFYDAKGVIIPIADLPQGISGNPDLDLPNSNAIHLGVVTPQFTLFGATVGSPSALSISFTWPANASTANIIASGLGGSGSHYDPDTEVLGIVMTTLFCFVMPSFLLAFAAVPGAELLYGKLLAANVVAPALQEVFTIWELSNGNKDQLFGIFWKACVKGGIAAALQGFRILLGLFLLWAAGVAGSFDLIMAAFPIAGLITQLIGMAAIVADIARATHDVVVSPWTYQTNVVPTHDITVQLQHDTGNDQFPSTATHYVVTAVFDDGKPYNQPIPITQPKPLVSLPPVVFKAVPLGGKLNVLVAFYADTGWLAGKGETGLLDNVLATFQTPPTITLTQNQVPIGPTTQYIHQAKTALDAGGNRIWQNTNTAPVEKSANLCENAPGQLCIFRKITVRQGTSSVPGNLGYAWGAYSSGVTNCSNGGKGQLDQMANIGTINPQSQYASTLCGLSPGTKLTYNLQGNRAANYYLESTTNLLRQVQLDPPGFADPRQSQAWGKLNLDSTDLLLHPGGKLVSVNADNHKLESLRVAPAAVTDEEAATGFTANLYSGQGSRPGLMHTPTAAAISADGVVLVLEAGNSRIHALDTCANPVQLFSKQPEQYFLALKGTDSDDFEYLDMAVEYSNYIYVLTRNLNSGRYQLDIYHPNQSDSNAISTTFDINAARLTVDLWRNVYTLNYEVLKMPDGTIPDITEPTVSMWAPTAPTAPAPQNPFALLTRSSGFSAPRPLRRRELFSSFSKRVFEG